MTEAKKREPHPVGVIVECGCQKRSVLVRLAESAAAKCLFVGKCHSCGTVDLDSITYYPGTGTGGGQA